MRASDKDRDRVADQLREALAEGRLTPEEHAERIDAVYAAKTYAELAPIIEDLPATGGTGVRPAPLVGPQPGLPAPPHQSANLVAVLSGTTRNGRWLVEPSTNVLTVFGGFVLDLRQAVLSQREVTINIVAVFSGGTIKIPPGVRVVSSVAEILSSVTIPPDDTDDPGAPVIRLTGMALFSGVDVKRKPAGDKDGSPADDHDYQQLSRDRHRELRELSRERQRELHERHREWQRESQRRRHEERHRRRDYE
jgi:Domain of unknown function (DUF1707)/Cell wall-active antibiotics response 4TMS YvqF